MSSPTANSRRRVLILGGGFGGVHAALELEKAIARGAELDVTLVTRDNFFLFTPMLHEVAAADVALDWTLDLCFAKDFACLTTPAHRVPVRIAARPAAGGLEAGAA